MTSMRFDFGSDVQIKERDTRLWGAVRGAVVGVRVADERDVTENPRVLLGENLVEIEIADGSLLCVPERVVEDLMPDRNNGA